MKSRLLLFFFLILSVFCYGTSRFFTKEEILSKKPASFFDMKLGDKQLVLTVEHLGTKRMPHDQLSIWISKTEGYERLNSLDSGVGESFDKPGSFSLNGFNFLTISTLPAGSGGFVQENIFWVAPDGSIQPVQFKQASETYEGIAKPDEVILNGGAKEFYVQDSQMKFEFWLARDTDPHCCPSAGIVSGTYKLVGKPQYDFFERKYKGAFEIQVDQLERSSGATASLTK